MSITTRDLHTADAMAREMAPRVDVNELSKIVGYARQHPDPEHCLELLNRLPKSGYVRSGRTRGYYRAIRQNIERHLRDISGQRFVATLAWSARLLRYYQQSRSRQ